jgi:glycosyltransferase involved in cell wall biosynthesis
MKTLPVTVVIPTYNAAATIERALDSVMKQSIKPAEIILIDDASIDETIAILERAQNGASTTKIKIIRLHKNSGPAIARNTGWNVATQPFVAFLDADDSWHPNKLEIQYRWMKENPSVVCSGHICEVIKKNHLICELAFTNSTTLPHRIYEMKHFILKNRLSTPSVMIKTAVQERFQPGKSYSEDYLLWLQVVRAYEKIAFIEIELGFLHKKKYGEAGLSSNLWQMQRGEINTLKTAYDTKLFRFNKITLLLLFTLSWIKFVRRLVINLFIK